MKYQLPICGFLFLALTAATAQIASHTPSAIATSAQTSPLQVSDKPVARVNGAVLTDRDLLREMYAIFPYAQQHNGFPKAQEAAIRQGALEMIIFEELVYQEAERRKLSVSAEKLNQAQAEFRKQFSSPDQYQQYLQSEMHGSEQRVRQQIRRSLLIEQILKTEVELKIPLPRQKFRPTTRRMPLASPNRRRLRFRAFPSYRLSKTARAGKAGSV